jgi:hypothetical protein
VVDILFKLVIPDPVLASELDSHSQSAAIPTVPSSHCVVLSFMGFDGAIGIPGADIESDDSLSMSAVNAIWAKWLPVFAPNDYLRQVVDAIGVALRLEAPDTHVACAHVRMSTCFNVVFERLSTRAPPVIELAYDFLHTAAVVERDPGMFAPDALLRFLGARDKVALLADVAEVVGCTKGIIVDAFAALRSWQAQQVSGSALGGSRPALRVFLCSEIASLLVPIASLLGLVKATSPVTFYDQFEFVS